MSRPLDYSRWNNIEVSDDEDDVHPNIDKESLWRWKKQARLEREKQEAEEKRRIKEAHAQARFKLIEAQQSSADEEMLENLKKQEAEFAQKEAEIERMERLYPKWTSSNMCRDAWSRTIISKDQEEKKESEEDVAARQQDFMKTNRDAIRHFGLLTNTQTSEDYLMENQQLVCEATANYLVVWAVDLEVEEKREKMKTVAKQTILMQYLLEVAKGSSKPKPMIIKTFFNKFRLAEQQYYAAYEDEVAGLVERILKRAKQRVEEAMKEVEEEERQKRIAASPGGLDPAEVMETLPSSLRAAFEARDIPALQAAIAEMPLEDAKYHIDRCTKSGLWVPQAHDDTTETDGQRGTEETAPSAMHDTQPSVDANDM